MSNPTLPGALHAEIAAEAVRGSLHNQEAARHRGVAWSAFAPEPPVAHTPETLLRRAREVDEARTAWRGTASARFLKAMVDGQAAAGLAHQTCERARAAWSRDFAAEARLCADTARELESLALRLLRDARRARRALS